MKPRFQLDRDGADRTPVSPGSRKAFLGVGVGFPLKINERGWLDTSRHEQDIEEAIRIILFTAKGERIARPDFGTRLNDFVFANMSPNTLAAIQSEVHGALSTWEPRIRVLKVTVTPAQGGSGSRLDIAVRYRVRRSQTVVNQVFPFYPQGES